MSQYEDYESTSTAYSRGRVPVGLRLYVGVLQDLAHRTGRTLADLRVLDAGGGTGNYSRGLLEAGVGAVTLMDASPGMLAQAQRALAPYVEAARCHVVHATMPALPADAEGRYDAVMCNQVLHHLDPRPGEWSVFRACLRSWRQALGAGAGVIIINFSPPSQLPSMWYLNAVPRVLERIARKLPTLPQMQKMAEETGLEMVTAEAHLLHSFFPKEVYENYDGISQAKYRSLDSSWALSTQEDIAEGEEYMRKLKSEGKLEEKVKEWEEYRLQHGQCTTVVLQKNGQA